MMSGVTCQMLCTETPDHESSDAYSCYLSTLKINIEDNLNLSRVQNTEINLKVPVQKETSEILLNDLQLKKLENGRKAGHLQRISC